MLIVTLLVLSIVSVQYVVYLLEGVMNVLNEFVTPVSIRLDMC